MRSQGLVEKNRLGVIGGSHGGFLTAHCITSHPHKYDNLDNICCYQHIVSILSYYHQHYYELTICRFKVAILRNPVVSFAAVSICFSIPKVNIHPCNTCCYES